MSHFGTNLLDLAGDRFLSWKKKAVPKFTFTLWWQLSFLGRPGNAEYGVSESLSFKNFPGPRTPVYNSCIRGWQSAGFSSNLLQNLVRLNIQFQKNSIPRQNEWWYRVLMKEKFWTQKRIGDQKSLWIMNLEENSCRNRESWRQKHRAKTIGIKNIKIQMIPLLLRPSWPDWASQSVYMARTSS